MREQTVKVKMSEETAASKLKITFQEYAGDQKIESVVLIDGKAFAFTSELGSRRIMYKYRYSNPKDVNVGKNAQGAWYFSIVLGVEFV